MPKKLWHQLLEVNQSQQYTKVEYIYFLLHFEIRFYFGLIFKPRKVKNLNQDRNYHMVKQNLSFQESIVVNNIKLNLKKEMKKMIFAKSMKKIIKILVMS